MIDCGYCFGKGEYFDAEDLHMCVCPHCQGKGKVSATNPSPGPTTTPVEKRVEDVATDVIFEHVQIYPRPSKLTVTRDLGLHWFFVVNDAWVETSLGTLTPSAGFYCDAITKLAAKLLEPQPISNPLVCGRCQEAVKELRDALKFAGLAYKTCASVSKETIETALTALLEGKS